MFNLGQVVITRNCMDRIDMEDVTNALARYIKCDWGNTCKEDCKLNDFAVTHGERLLAVYKAKNGTTFWIITEYDRSATTVLLPEDY